VSKIVSIGLFYRPLAAKKQFLPVFWTSAFSDVASWRQSEKAECSAQLQTFPYLTHQTRFCILVPSWQNRAHKL